MSGAPGQDTVAAAAATPRRPQPYAGLGLTAAEYNRIRQILGRRPTDAELAIYAGMWSEHCSYKSSKVYLRQFAEKAPESAALLAGIGQQAGVVDIGQGYAVTFKIESHNHPSYVEPHQGAATGIGGIVRDILAMGARPVAVMDALRFGPADAADTRRVLPGVVSGISFYGNCLGLPNIGGELSFDPCYAGNPLVNALCVGVMRHGDLMGAAATGPGNQVVLFGARTGPDGIGGASVLASASFGDEGSNDSRAAVDGGPAADDGARPSAAPPSAVAPSATPPSAVAPSAAPPSAVPPSAVASSAVPPSAVPPSAVASSAAPPSATPPSGVAASAVTSSAVPPSAVAPSGVAASAVTSSAAPPSAAAKRPSVQVGDPFMEKLLVECCLELYAGGRVTAIQDLGAAGIACATTELAAAGTGGMRVFLDAVPVRDASLGPAAILASESQERMMAIVEPQHLAGFQAVCAKWGVQATAIGEVTDTGRLQMTWHGELIVDMPPGSAADDGPVYHRAAARPAGQDALAAAGPDLLARPDDGPGLRAALLDLLAWPDLAGKTWVTEQYDRYVRGNTVLAMPEDAGLLRIDEQTGLGVALATDGNGRYCRLDPYAGTQLALAEAYRNVAATGARPLAVTNCLNFGSPEDPAVMWQFEQATAGLADGCAALGVPVTGGNVSFYNQTGGAAIHPTPVVGVLGVHDDVRRRLSIGFAAGGASIVLLGRTSMELGGSAWARAAHGHLGGRPPQPDLEAERALAAVLIAAASGELLAAAHDLSDGGLAIALAESCLRGGLGCRVRLPGDPFSFLFSESAARAVVAVRPGADSAFAALAAGHGVPAETLGTTGGGSLTVDGCFEIPLDELAAVHRGTLPALFG